MSDINATILEGFQQINARLDRFETRQERMENDLKGVREDIDGLKTDVAGLQIGLASVQADVKKNQADLEHLRAAFYALPDFRLMMVRGEVTLRKINEIEHSLVDLRARLTEIYGAMATDAEINIFRDELKAYRETALTNEIRLATLERHVLPQPAP